jgi:transcriptional regulator with XRE-family HTH domain
MVRNFESMDARIIGERLRELRGDKSVVETAKALDISPSTWSMYENGERIPRDNIKLRIAKYFRKPIHLIFFTEDTHIA